MDAFLLITKTLIIPTFLGYFITSLLDKKNPFTFSIRIAIGYGLGLGCLTQWMLIQSVFNIPLSFTGIFLPLFVILIILIIKRLRNINSTSLPSSQTIEFKWEPVSSLFVLYILLCTVFVFWRAINVPLSSWDAFSYNSFVAKVIYYEHSLQYLPNMPHYEYPLHAPFLQVWASICLEEWNDIFINIFFPLYFISFFLFLFYFLYQFTSQRWALFGVALFVSSNLLIHHASIAYRDVTLMYYINISLLLLVLWVKDNCYGKLVLAGIMAGLATSVKLDATGYILVLSLILIVILLNNKSKMKQKIKDFLIFTTPSFFILLFFNIYKMFVVEPQVPQITGEKLSFDLYSVKLKLDIEFLVRFKTVMARIFDNLFMSGNWNIIWLLFLISLLNLRKRWNSFEIKLLLIALIAFFGLQAAGYTFTQYYYWISDTNTSLSRHLLCHFPVVVVLIVLLNGQNKNHTLL